jgi:uncharacterized protein YjiS (DUF1127 family)
MSDEELRGDRSNPVVAMQAELGNVLDRYGDVVQAKPEYVASLLVDYADSIRELNDLDHNLEDYGNGVHLLHIEDMTAFIGVPRTGDHADVDAEALDELLDADVEDLGFTGEPIDVEAERGRDE